MTRGLAHDLRGAINGIEPRRYEGTSAGVRKHDAESTVQDGTSGLSTDSELKGTIVIVIGSWSRLLERLTLLLPVVLLLASAARDSKIG